MARRNRNYCPICGRHLEKDHLVLYPGGPKVCQLEFSVINTTTGKRRASDPRRERSGIRRTARNQAAWINPDRIGS